MWKPGTAKPESQSPKTPTIATTPTTKKQEPSNGTLPLSGNTPKSAEASAKKRLSGATMNMRFMKRKKETQEHENSRRNSSGAAHSPAAGAAPKVATPGAREEEENDPMDVEVEEEDDESCEPFSRATPDDMYGMQASLIGRRSFGGFNPSIEEAWKDAKDRLESDRLENNSSNQKVSDEELLQRYKNIVKKRSDSSSRPIGNLKKTHRGRKQR
jgi:hypothetical protein